MRYLAIAFLILSFLSTPAFGRLGEDEGTAKNRYGDPVKEEQIQNYDKKVYYNNNKYKMSILYKDGKAVIMNYQMASQGNISMIAIPGTISSGPIPSASQRWEMRNSVLSQLN